MSARESGATMTQSTGEPEVEGRSEGANGAAWFGSGACRAPRAGSAEAAVESPITAANAAIATRAVRTTRRRLDLGFKFRMEVSGSNYVTAAAPGLAVFLATPLNHSPLAPRFQCPSEASRVCIRS